MRGALYNDSKFLAELNVMYYSLVVGVDSAKNELVVGIVGKLIMTNYKGCISFAKPILRLYSYLYVG